MPSVRPQTLALSTPPDRTHHLGDRPVVSVRAGNVRVRHQAAQPFRLAYAGDRPVLIYVFHAGSPAAGGPRWRNGSFGLLLPGAAAEIDHPEPLDLLAVAYDRPGPFAIGAGVASCGLTDRGVRVLAQELRRVLREEDAADLRYVEALADGLLTRAAGVAAPPPTRAVVTQPLPPQKVRRLVDHIEHHLDQGLPVAELAALAGLSRPHFTRAFQAAVGESPHRFVLRRRLAAARQYLDRGTEDLATIAVRCGFSSHAHLSSAFRAEFGISPSAYRRGIGGAAPRLT